ncbi:integral membrane protein [Streptomyces sp. SPB074]|nr:integral membrane protein [Streptomyces sp. SPB074]
MTRMEKWTPRHEAPEPLEGPVVATIAVGTGIWFLLFLVQLPFYGWFDDHGHLWWLWTCAAGAGLGLFGTWYVRRRDEAIKRHAAGRATAEGPGA